LCFLHLDHDDPSIQVSRIDFTPPRMGKWGRFGVEKLQ
jgi:hypothetical protein